MQVRADSQAHPHSIFSIQELLESIIECLSHSVSDLRSCALVSRSWTPRAQSYLFWTVSFTPEYDGSEKYERSLLAFETHPNLARFVRHIIISVNLHWLLPVPRISFPSLREITIRSGSSRPNETLTAITVASIPTIQAYLRSAAIRRVNFNGWFHPDILDSYFHHCSRNIKSLGLDLRNIAMTVSLPDDVVATLASYAADAPVPPQDKIELSHLTFVDSKILDHWLLRPRCAFAISRLRSVETHFRALSLSSTSLATILPSIEVLAFTKLPDPNCLLLATLSKLRVLDICIPPNSHQHKVLMAALLRPPLPRHLEIVAIRIDIQIYPEEYAYSFHGFGEDAAALAALPSMSRLDVHYERNSHQAGSVKFFMADFR
ncbi:hypothetical protein DFH06DRAFT_1486683 [Mycena polygramma]|nr:hypothetical protein DFH06DRAFT_1486683 [Mycena polygramma]